jgi:pilus assembly protein Flp/PilA
MLKKLRTRLCGDVRGATAIEYALIAGGIALAIVAALMSVGQNLSAMLMNVVSGFH